MLLANGLTGLHWLDAAVVVLYLVGITGLGIWMTRRVTGAVLGLALLAGGCTHHSPGWADSVNPCCGQDEIMEGRDPLIPTDEIGFRVVLPSPGEG